MMSIDQLNEQQKRDVNSIVSLLTPDKRVFVVTGAGISADSGLPTYRGVGGLYNSGETEQGMTIEQLLSSSTFRSQPKLTWKYLAEIGKACLGATFNRGHEILSEMESHFANFVIMTQNIDGFHRLAGSKNLIEIHGNLNQLRCEECEFRKEVTQFDQIDIPPYCDHCQAMLRPNVILFDEMLGTHSLEHLSRQWQTGFDIVLSIGTTSVFPYIAEPVYHCADKGKPAIEINPSESNVSSLCTYRLPVSATVALEAIWAGVKNKNI